MPHPLSRRDIVMRFSALVAKAMNASAQFTELDDGRIYFHLIETLSGKRGPQSKTFLHLTGHDLVQHRYSAEEAASIYFERVMERRLFLARNNPCHKGHEVLHALCRRGAGDGWDKVTLQRTLMTSPTVPFRLPEGFHLISARLAGSPNEISKGNPAASARANDGPLYIEFCGARVELPEELSLWAAICAAPRRLHSLVEKEWACFRNLIIRAIETANAPFAAQLSAGLWPPDWDGILSTHQVKQLAAFLSDVRKGASAHTIAAWRGVWDAGRTVSGFESADELWDSQLGAALRGPQARAAAPDTDVEDLAVSEPVDPALDDTGFCAMVAKCRADGAIDDLESWIYLQIYEGRTAAGLEKEPAIRKRLRERGLSMVSYLEDMQARVHAFVRALGEFHPDREGEHNGDHGNR